MPESTRTVNRWTTTRKAAVVLELLRGGDAVELARNHGLSQAQLFAWRDRFLEGGQAALKTRRGQLEVSLPFPLPSNVEGPQTKNRNALSGQVGPVRALSKMARRPNCEGWQRSWNHSGSIVFTRLGGSMSPARPAVKLFLEPHPHCRQSR